MIRDMETKMKIDPKATREELQEKRLNNWIRLVKHEEHFGDNKWRAAVGMNLMPMEPQEKLEDLEAEAQKWGTEEEINRLIWWIALINGNANKTKE